MPSYKKNGASLVIQMVKYACSVGHLGLILGWGRSLEKGMATHSRILAWRSPWTGEPGGQATVHEVKKSQTKEYCLFFVTSQAKGQRVKLQGVYFKSLKGIISTVEENWKALILSIITIKTASKKAGQNQCKNYGINKLTFP